jgi:type VI secretion system secreted protein VgrG
MHMPQDYQANRVFQVTTPFGADTVIFGRMRATEQLSQPFELDLTLFSEKGDLNADTILSKPVAVTIAPGGQPTRHFHGLATDFAQIDYDNHLHEYHVTVRPWFWFLTRTADCRVFQNKTVPAIFQEVCQQAGFTDFRLALSGTYDPWEYCVQFRETDFNFLSRLFEQEGIFYYFEHSDSRHVLVLSDDVAQLASAPGYDSVPYWPPSGMDTLYERDHLAAWSFQKSFHPGTYATREFDFKAPSPVLAGTSSISRAYNPARFEVFDFPSLAAIQTSAAVERVAKIRVQELQCAQMVARGSGDAVGLATGRLFVLASHPRADLNMRYLIRSTAIDMSNNSYFGGGGGTGGGGAPTQFTIAIEALDAREPYRPSRSTPKPLVHGLQTALVVGPKGTEIYTDEFGRVKVQFHWDRQGKLDENSSCWMRVGQAWAGRNWGAVQIPRVGQEVIVSFLDGDPDRPVIIGSVYNGSNKPPYPLPANKTQSGVKSRSSMDGTSGNFNEIRFEDKKGSEQLYMQAEKDHEVLIKNDAKTSVGNNMTLTVSKDQTVDIGGAQVTKVGQSVVINAGDSLTLAAGVASITLTKTGAVVISGELITVNGIGPISITGVGPVNITGATGLITGLTLVPI